jgi:hypothetical protein
MRRQRLVPLACSFLWSPRARSAREGGPYIPTDPPPRRFALPRSRRSFSSKSRAARSRSSLITGNLAVEGSVCSSPRWSRECVRPRQIGCSMSAEISGGARLRRSAPRSRARSRHDRVRGAGTGRSQPSLSLPGLRRASASSRDIAGRRPRDPIELIGAIEACHDRLVSEGVDLSVRSSRDGR